MENPSRYLPHITWINFLEGTFYDNLYAICFHMIVNKDNLLTADARISGRRFSLSGGREKRPEIHLRFAQNFEFPFPISFEVTTMSSVVPSPGTGNPIHPFVFPNFFPWLAHSCPQSPSFLGHVRLARRPTLGGSRWHAHKHRQIKWYISRLGLCVKLTTYHSLKATFCPKWEVSVNVGLGEGWMSSFP